MDKLGLFLWQAALSTSGAVEMAILRIGEYPPEIEFLAGSLILTASLLCYEAIRRVLT